ncbi:MAG TPA: endo-1,4-beta-xylanase [Bacteroidales bacterium]
MKLMVVIFVLTQLHCSAQLTLKQALKDKFFIGTALNANQITERDSESVRLIKEQFNAIVPENCMKSAIIHPKEDEYDFALADQFVEFGEKNNLFVTGHTLIWHGQLARWFCVDENGNNVSAEVLKDRMKKHIYTIVGRYKSRVKGWDVVNEAIEDNGAYRKSKFYEILGEDFIPLAFQYAHEADPNAELYYNDYNMAMPGKRDAVVALIKKLKNMGIRIDAVGMQGHLLLNFPAVDEFEKSMLAFANAGVKVQITELDMSILPRPRRNVGADVSANFQYKQELNPYVNALPDSVSQVWNQRMNDFFKLFLKHKDIIRRVTLWGASDGDSWLNNWPIPGRTDYPLLFDRHYRPKAGVGSIIEEATGGN